MSKEAKRIRTPLSTADVEELRAGDSVLLSGVVYAARDAAHKKMIDLLDRGQKLPFDVEGQVVYYVGPSPAKPGQVIGSAGPTTSVRMDAYAPRLLEIGLKGMIGKGSRGEPVKEAMRRYKAVYFGAVGGAAALIAHRIKESEVIAWEELGPEAVRRMVVEDLPLTVINDTHGGDLYIEGRKRYHQQP